MESYTKEGVLRFISEKFNLIENKTIKWDIERKKLKV